MHAVLLPNGPLERTIDVQIEDWTDPGWPDALALTIVHGAPEAVVHDGQHYEVQAVGATYWRLKLVLPGGLGIYDRAAEVIPAAHPVALGDPRPAAMLPRPVLGVNPVDPYQVTQARLREAQALGGRG